MNTFILHRGNKWSGNVLYSYRYGFNGMESDDEMYSQEGNSYDFGARMYDARVGRFSSVDPLTTKYPYFSPYLNSGNMMINSIDQGGLEPIMEGKKLVGYRVEAGQGPSQIAADLNNPETQKKYGYTLQKKVTYKDIVNQNYETFTENGNYEGKDWVDNPNDGGYTQLNINEGDELTYKEKEVCANDCILLKGKPGPEAIKQKDDKGWWNKFADWLDKNDKATATKNETEIQTTEEAVSGPHFGNTYLEPGSTNPVTGIETNIKDYGAPPKREIKPFPRYTEDTSGPTRFNGQTTTITKTWLDKEGFPDSSRRTSTNSNGDTTLDYKYNDKTKTQTTLKNIYEKN